MKKLIALISTEGKSPQQISEETIKAFSKYNKVKKEVSNSTPEDTDKSKQHK